MMLGFDGLWNILKNIVKRLMLVMINVATAAATIALVLIGVKLF